MEFGPVFQCREGLQIGARQPCLGAQRDDFIEQRAAPQRVQMGRDLIEQQDRRGAIAALPHEIGMRQHEADEQAFCSPVEQTLAGICLGP